MDDSIELADEYAAPNESQGVRVPLIGYQDQLNEAQLKAVQSIDGPVLVLAGAGTGKTRVLTSRLAHILRRGKADPGQILAVTFTNKAAREMRERVARLIGRSVEGWWVGTFHHLGARLLRYNAEAVGLTPNFTILDQDDQTRLVKQFIDIHEIDDKRFPARSIASIIQRWKDRGLMPDKVSLSEGAGIEDGRILDLYRDYQVRLKQVNAADFGDLLLLCIDMFQNQPEILSRYQNQFRFILVDEYQDTNVSQYLWLRFLAHGHKNICCVGDDDQSIYSWRGAEVGNILRFEEDFTGSTVIKLERNYRSTRHILATASGLIAHNEDRLGKTLWTEINEGELVRIRGLWDGEEEARGVGEEIESLHGKGHKLNDIAVLVRAGFQTREFEERLITIGVPYRVIGGPRFYERQEIRDAIAYLRVIVQMDDDLAFERIINIPKRGIGQATLRPIHMLAREDGVSLIRAFKMLIETDEIKPRNRKALAGLLADFDRWRDLAKMVPHSELLGTVLDESGYMAMWSNSMAPEASGRIDNLKELVAAIAGFESLSVFLEHVSLVMENEENAIEDKVNLMTLHGAKGLEFSTVFLPGWEEGLFPHQRALDESGTGGLEEERRLAYVGLTRARERAIISFAANRRIYGNWQSSVPSRFISELPVDNTEIESASGLYAGDTQGASYLSDSESVVKSMGRPKVFHVNSSIIDKRDSPYSSGDRVGNDQFNIDDRIFHQKFGYGRIKMINGEKLEVAFEKAGDKKVMKSFVEVV